MVTMTQLWRPPITHTRDRRTPSQRSATTQTSRCTSLRSARCPVQHAYIIACCHVITPDYLIGTQAPPVLSWDLTSEKTKKSNHRRSTWRLYRFPYVRTLCFSDAPPTPSLIKRHVASSTVVFNRRLRFLQRSKPLNPSRFSLFHHLSSPSSIPNAFSANHETSRLS